MKITKAGLQISNDSFQRHNQQLKLEIDNLRIALDATRKDLAEKMRAFGIQSVELRRIRRERNAWVEVARALQESVLGLKVDAAIQLQVEPEQAAPPRVDMQAKVPVELIKRI